MTNTTRGLGWRARLLLVALVSGLTCTAGNAAVTVLGVQYQQDNPFPEFQCLWHDQNYPTSCGSVVTGANVHVYLKNTGASSVTIDDVNLAGYSLKTVIKMSTDIWNPDEQYSIYFYWDNPPQDIFDAGEPVWYKGDPATIPPGGVGQAVVRLRSVPTTPTVSVGVLTSGGTVNTNIAVDPSAPQLASASFSPDRTKVYLHWRRSGGASPAAVWMDGINVTTSTVTVGDAAFDFAESVLALSTALSNMSYHVFQGVYDDGKTATASLRVWANPFLYGSVQMFPIATNGISGSRAWIDDAVNHGLNSAQLTGVGEFFDVNYASSRNYGFVCIDNSDIRITQPQLWFLNDEPDNEEYNQSNTHCGTGLRIPCDSTKYSGTLVMKEVAQGETLRAASPLTPTTANLDGVDKPNNYYSWGQAVDVLQVDPYYQPRLWNAYWFNPVLIPLYSKATYVYAVSRAATAAAEPNPTHALLYSCEYKDSAGGQLWPFPTPESKRIEVYYALAGGAKGITYWWFKPGYAPNGLGDQSKPEAQALWKEIGLLGNEIKTAQPLLVTSRPVDLTLAPSANVWVRALASGTDTIILLVVNDNYYNDEAGCHYTPVSNATVTTTLPSWMQPSPAAFEITAGGIRPVSTQVNGSQLQVNLGTLALTRMIVLTKDLQLQATIQQRYEQQVQPGICVIAPELCVNVPPKLGYVRLGSDLVFSWPTNVTGYVLEYVTNLPPMNWTPASPAPVVMSGQYVVTNTMITQGGTERYYRLNKL